MSTSEGMRLAKEHWPFISRELMTRIRMGGDPAAFTSVVMTRGEPLLVPTQIAAMGLRAIGLNDAADALLARKREAGTHVTVAVINGTLAEFVESDFDVTFPATSVN